MQDWRAALAQTRVERKTYLIDKRVRCTAARRSVSNFRRPARSSSNGWMSWALRIRADMARAASSAWSARVRMFP